MKGHLPEWLSFEINLAGEDLLVSPRKVLYWPKEKTLFLADCHFGKVAHFRLSGIGVPQEAGNQTFAELNQILISIKPDRVVFLGDLFHSQVNQDFERFALWRNGFSDIDFQLVLGNHDRASGKYLENLGLQLHAEWKVGPFYCSHYPDYQSDSGFNLSGHIHPAFRLTGIANQSATCPCFWIGDNFMVLPAFGSFTGIAKIKLGRGERVLAIAGSRLFDFQETSRQSV